MHLQPIVPGSAERWDQGRVDIQDPVLVKLRHPGRNHAEEARKDNQIRAALLHGTEKRVLKLIPGEMVPGADHHALKPRLLRPLQRVHIVVVRQNQADPRVLNGSVFNGVDDRLEVRTPARHQHCYVQHIVPRH